MKKNIHIADSELPIMKVLWDKGELTSTEILNQLEGNKSTLKTLLQRLVTKGAVKASEITSRSYRYSALVSREEYTSAEGSGFLQKVFDGSARRMLLNFVKEEHITKEDLKALIDQIEEDEQ